VRGLDVVTGTLGGSLKPEAEVARGVNEDTRAARGTG
jgi:hypothetical protein